MLQRLLIALVQVKAGNNSEGLLNEILQIVYSLYQSKQITKKVHNSSNINEVIRSVLNNFFFYDKISQVQKSIKTQFQFFINVTLKSI